MRSLFATSLFARLLISIVALVLAAILLVSAAAIYLLPTTAVDAKVVAIFLALAVLILIAVALDVYFLARYITNPLTELAQATRAIAAGQLDLPLTINRRDEIGALADDLRAMQKELVASRRALEAENARYAELNELKERLLANVPHEIKTPLSAIAASLEILQDAGAQLPLEDRARLLESIQRSVVRLQYLIDNMLDAASIQAGQFRVHLQATPFAPMVEDARLFIQPLLDQNRQTLQVRDASDGALVQADPARITQVFTNLLSNACKYGQRGEAILLEALRETKVLRVCVAYPSARIPSEEQNQIFERFTRGASALGVPGAGLGLGIAKMIVELHGGEIGLPKTDGNRFELAFTLPLVPEGENENPRR